MGRMQRSFELGKASWRVLRTNRALGVVALFSLIGAAVVGLVFAGLAWAAGGGSSTEFHSGPAFWLVVLLGYVASAVVTTYCTAALVVGADVALSGGEATVALSLAGANKKWHRILPWALVVATVSIVVRALERNGIVGQIIAGFLGLAWAVLTFLALPVIVLEDVGVRDTLTRSKDLLKQTWGENLFGQLGFGLFSIVLMLPGLAVFGLSILSGVDAIMIVGIAIAVVWTLVVSVIVSALSGIYRTALYRYAVEGFVPEAFAGVGLETAFQPRTGGKRFGL